MDFKSRHSHNILKWTQSMNCKTAVAKYLEQRQQSFYLHETQPQSTVLMPKSHLISPQKNKGVEKTEQYKS